MGNQKQSLPPKISELLNMVKKLIIDSLGPEPSPPEIEKAVNEFPFTAIFEPLREHKGALLTAILNHVTTYIRETSSLVDSGEDHEPWLDDVLTDLDPLTWKFTHRLIDFSTIVKSWPEVVVEEIDKSTTHLLSLLENPKREGSWDRRGMVVGEVQSGKTAHYTSLSAKALDTGYRVIFIIAGLANNLRSQTQERTDAELVGCRSVDRKITGVGKRDEELMRIPPERPTLMTTTENDINRTFIQQFGAHINSDGTQTFLAVIKKNVSILKNLNTWLEQIGTKVPGDDKNTIRGVPFLLIDDEADLASIDINDPMKEEDPSATNREIRRLLNSFNQRAYVAYTATPYANIFMQPRREHDEYGEDLFPRSFILNLPAPSNHFGPLTVFGHDGDPTVGLDPKKPLPVWVEIEDTEDWVPPKHKVDHTVNGIPGSLERALRTFILSCAARRARGQFKEHNTMLVHVSRYVKVHEQITELLHDEALRLGSLFQFADPEDQEIEKEKYRSVWEEEFGTKFEEFQKGLKDKTLTDLTWEEVCQEIANVFSEIKVRQISGAVGKDDSRKLNYTEHPEGLTVIAIGGDKLSRGLTLEGLSVSYFSRQSLSYDTLFQMGRWFGYRPGYGDLCRLYCPQNLFGWYRQIALSTAELKNDFDMMARTGKSPEEFGLKVRTCPGALMVTARNKQRWTDTLETQFSGTLNQTTIIDRNGASNITATDEFLSGLPEPVIPERNGNPKSAYHWKDVSKDKVLDFLSKYHSNHPVFLGGSKLLRDYINQQSTEQGELTHWSVILMTKKNGRTLRLGNQEIRLLKRNEKNGAQVGADDYSFGALVGSDDETLDLTDREYQTALEATRKEFGGGQKAPKRELCREARPPERGLLLIYPIDLELQEDTASPSIGISLSFPVSDTAKTVEYRMNDVMSELQKKYFEEQFDDE